MDKARPEKDPRRYTIEGTWSWQQISDEARQLTLARPESTKPADDAPKELDTFDSFDQHTLVALAHVEHQPEPANAVTTWTEFTSDEINDLLCLEWLAGEIYDVSKPRSAKEREKNSSPLQLM